MNKRSGVTSHRCFGLKTVWDDVPVVFSEEGMGRIEYSTFSIG